MKRDLELMTSLLIEAENSSGREISDSKEVESILLLQDEEYVDAQTQYSDDGMPQSTKVIRVRSKGHSALENMRASESRILEVKNYQEIGTLKSDTEKARDGLELMRNKEIERYENIMYLVSSGIVAFSLSTGSFCYTNNISLSVLKWILLVTLSFSGVTIISLLIAGKASALSHENGFNAIDIDCQDQKNEYARKANNWDCITGIWNSIALISFAIGLLFALFTLIYVGILIPEKNFPNGKGHKTSVMMEAIYE